MDALGINLGFLLAQIFNFLLIFLLLAKGVWPRVLKMLDERQEKIANGLEDARAAEEARRNAEHERERVLAGARADSQRILEEARQHGEEQARAMLRDAQQEAEDRRTQAHAQAEEERNRILSESRDQIVALAMAAAERVLGQSLDAAQQRSVIKRFFTDIPAEARGLGQHVEVTSALPLTDEEQQQVRQATGATELDFQVNPSILGGLILRSGDKVVDGSVRGDMAALSERLR